MWGFLFYNGYMIFKVFGIGKDIRDARNDPSGFMAQKVVDVVRGVFLIWKIVILLPFIPLVIFGFTDTWGGPYSWVRIISIFWFILSLVAFMIMSLVTKVLSRKTKGVADSVVEKMKEVINENNHG